MTPLWLHYKSTQSPSIHNLVNGIKKGTARAVSDGSYFPDTGVGTAAWTIESENQLDYITGTLIVPGPPSVQSAYRSKLTGILAILEKLRVLCSNHNILKGQITISCDRITALLQSLTTNPLSQSPNILHSDILSISSKLAHHLPISIIPLHVKGHQDNNKLFSQLDRPAQLNTKMDILAKETTKQQFPEYHTNYRSHNMSFPQIMYNQEQIQHKTINNLYFHISADKLVEYWKSKL